MNDIWILLRVYLLSAFGYNKFRHSRDKRERRNFILLCAAVVFTIVTLMGLVFAYCLGIGYVMGELASAEMTITIMCAVASIIVLISAVMRVAPMLFGSSDMQLLLPLPVKTSKIVAAKVLYLYLMNLGLTAAVMLPCFAAVALLTGPQLSFYLLAVLLLFFIPMLPLCLGGLISVLISWISSGFKGKNIASIVLMLLLLVLVLVGSFSMSDMDETMLLQMSQSIADSVNGLYPLAPVLTAAVTGADLLQALLFMAASLLPFALFQMAVGRYFVKLYEGFTRSGGHTRYSFKGQKASSPILALYKKEMRRLFSSSIYVLNVLIGAFMLTFFSVALLFSGDAVLENLEIPAEWFTMMAGIIPFVISALVSMVYASAVSISLEGKSFPLLKSLPVSAMQVFAAKGMLNLCVTVPTVLVNAAILSIYFKMSPMQALWCFVLPLLYTLVSTLVNLLINLKFPVFDWVNETMVIKQSASAFLGMFPGMIVAALGGALVVFTGPAYTNLVMLGTFALLAIAALGLYQCLKGWGTRRYHEI